MGSVASALKRLRPAGVTPAGRFALAPIAAPNQA